MNLKVILILVSLTIISYKNIAQVPDLILNDYEHKQILPQLIGCSHSNHYKNIFSEKLCGTHNYNFDILNYDLFMDWFEVLSGEDTVVATHSYNGLQKIRFMSKENNLNNITLDAAYLRINSIKFNNLIIENFTQPEENRLTINLPKKLDSGEVAIVEIDYSYILDFNLGMYVYPKGKVIYGNDTLNNEEKLCYTFSQPEIARFWMPCNDNPNEKALVSIAVKVPEKFTVSSNGDLDSVITQENQNSKSKTFFWSEKRSPLPSYLMVVHASVYKMYEDKYIRVSNPLDTVPIYNYVWQKDYDSKFIDGAVFDAVNSFKPTADILAGY